jgi:ureidoacrylate peracid hydrolase
MYTVECIDPGQTALIVVDMQNDFVAPGAPLESSAGRAMVPHLQRALDCCREEGIPVIYTAHVHRPDGCDLGLLAHAPAIARRDALVDGSAGVAIFPEIAPRDGEIVISKHRFSAFYGTDLEIILRGLGVTTVVITGVTTENCCHATARDAFFRDFQVVFLTDATATSDYPDLGYGSMSAAEVHRATLVILARDTADVITTETFLARVATAPEVEKSRVGVRTNDIAIAASQAAPVP